LLEFINKARSQGTWNWWLLQRYYQCSSRRIREIKTVTNRKQKFKIGKTGIFRQRLFLSCCEQSKK